MAGIPYHSAYTYIKSLIKKGYKVAICEQVEDSSRAKKLIKREVVRVITPGTLIEEELLTKENNYLISIYRGRIYGIAFIDVSTGEFLTSALESFEDVVAEILKFSPIECIVPDNFEKIEDLKKLVNVIHTLSLDKYSFESCLKSIKDCVQEFDELDLEKECLKACGSALNYIKENLLMELSLRLQKYVSRDYMILDSTTIKNLEIFMNLVDRSRRDTLVDVLDRTMTAMGGRLLRRWLQSPLLNVDEIEKRLEAVEELYKKSFLRKSLREILREIYDLERIVSRIKYKKVNARDFVALKNSLKAVESIKSFFFSDQKNLSRL